MQAILAQSFSEPTSATVPTLAEKLEQAITQPQRMNKVYKPVAHPTRL